MCHPIAPGGEISCVGKPYHFDVRVTLFGSSISEVGRSEFAFRQPPPRTGKSFRFVSCVRAVWMPVKTGTNSPLGGVPFSLLARRPFPIPFCGAGLSLSPWHIVQCAHCTVCTLSSVHTVQCAPLARNHTFSRNVCPSCTKPYLFKKCVPLFHEAILFQEMCAPLARNHTVSLNVCPSCTKPHFFEKCVPLLDETILFCKNTESRTRGYVNNSRNLPTSRTQRTQGRNIPFGGTPHSD